MRNIMGIQQAALIPIVSFDLSAVFPHVNSLLVIGTDSVFWSSVYQRETAKTSLNWFRWTGKAI